MSLLAPLRYFAARLRYRDDASIASHLRVGLGIEIRARKLAVHWRPHQDRSREAQSRWSASGGRLAVLGAGRLLDFEHSLAQRFDHLRFVDADPLCEPFWKRKHPQHESVIADVSGCLRDWTAELPRAASWQETLSAIGCHRAPVVVSPWLRDCLAQRFDHLRFVDADPLCEPFWKRKHPRHESVIADVSGCLRDWTAALPQAASWQETLSAIGCHRAPVVVAPWLRDCSAILSVNLLSQIPIAWQERVETHLRKQFGSALVQSKEEEWLAAVEPGARSLVESHVAMLNQSGARDILLITDLAHIEYKGTHRYSRRRLDPPPNVSGAEREDALYGVEHPALSNYRRTAADEWLWHISPQGLESSHKGSIHVVGSFAFQLSE